MVVAGADKAQQSWVGCVVSYINLGSSFFSFKKINLLLTSVQNALRKSILIKSQ